MTNTVTPLPIELVRNCRVLPDRIDVLRYLPSDIVFVEVGAALGDFTARVLETCAVRHYVTIDSFNLHDYPDTWDGRVGRELGGQHHRSFFERKFAAEIDAGRMTVLQGDNTARLEDLADRSIDVISLTAEHTYDSVAASLAVIRRKLVPGGIILLSNYTTFDRFRMIPYGVIEAANEFMTKNRWEMIFFALQRDMFCDIAIRELPGKNDAAAIAQEMAAAAPAAAPEQVAAAPAATDAGPTIVELSDPTLGAHARECLALLRPMDVVDGQFVRKGRDYDGGYVMLDSGLDGTIAYSLGISDDVSWDLELAALGCQLFQYDHTVANVPMPHANFHFFRTGIAAHGSSDGVFRTLDDLIDRNGHAGRRDLILKMDIEGDEWGVLAAISDATLTAFSQILVELHGFVTIDRPERRELIINGLRRLSAFHQVVHVHGNNFGWLGVIGGVTLPDTIEATFVRRSDHSFVECVRDFPTPLDMPCNPAAADFMLGALGRSVAP